MRLGLLAPLLAALTAFAPGSVLAEDATSGLYNVALHGKVVEAAAAYGAELLAELPEEERGDLTPRTAMTLARIVPDRAFGDGFWAAKKALLVFDASQSFRERANAYGFIRKPFVLALYVDYEVGFARSGDYACTDGEGRSEEIVESVKPVKVLK